MAQGKGTLHLSKEVLWVLVVVFVFIHWLASCMNMYQFSYKLIPPFWGLALPTTGVAYLFDRWIPAFKLDFWAYLFVYVLFCVGFYFIPLFKA